MHDHHHIRRIQSRYGRERSREFRRQEINQHARSFLRQKLQVSRSISRALHHGARLSSGCGRRQQASRAERRSQE
ncbi:hypothetical protein A2U01_0075122, partial [Trifolium medium]|nr:hypothetical protein [Trifolium medium]